MWQIYTFSAPISLAKKKKEKRIIELWTDAWCLIFKGRESLRTLGRSKLSRRILWCHTLPLAVCLLGGGNVLGSATSRWLFQVRLGDAGGASALGPDVWKTTFRGGARSTCRSWTFRKLGFSSSVELLAAGDVPSEDTTQNSSDERRRSGAASKQNKRCGLNLGRRTRSALVANVRTTCDGARLREMKKGSYTEKRATQIRLSEEVGRDVFCGS